MQKYSFKQISKSRKCHSI